MRVLVPLDTALCRERPRVCTLTVVKRQKIIICICSNNLKLVVAPARNAYIQYRYVKYIK